MTSLYQFLDGCRTQDKPTHQSMVYPTGKYMIRGNDVDMFMDFYCRDSLDHRLGILESTAIHTVIPVLVDADIKKEGNEITRLYEPALILRLIQIYQTVIRQIVNDISDEDLLCVVLEKDPYLLENEKTMKKYIKHGFHLHFPRCLISRIIQEKELIPRVKLEWKKQVGYNEFSVSLDNLIDRAYCKGTPWLMYRSSKSANMQPYLITYMVDSNGNTIENLLPLLYMSLYRTDGTRIELSWDNIEYHLPRILSISPHGREEYIHELKDDLPPIPSVSKIQTQLNQQLNHMNMLSEHRNEDESTMVDKLLDILNIQRSVDRNDWIYVGWVLFNIFNGNQDGLDKWIRFSQKSPENFSLEVCNYEWSRMIRRDMSIGSLKFIAKQDNPERYNETMDEFMVPHIEKAMKLNGSHNDLARALFEKYEHQFVCASIKDKIWYEYSDHVWNRIDEGFSLRKKISEEIVDAYEAIGKSLVSKCSKAEEEEQSLYNKKLKNCMRIVTLLKSAPYKNNIMKECTEVFYQPKFFKELDHNPFLFAFQNGVYDLTEHVFRDGRPSDKNSIKAPIRYREDLSDTHPEVMQVYHFLEKIFPDRTIRDYFFDVSAQIFIGGNHAKIVQVWTGEGDNGKSVTQNLFEKMLGSYSIKLPTSLIVGKRTQSSAACPELVRAGNGVRFAMLQEPDGKDVINVGILKELSGNDSFFARGLYKEGSEIIPMFKLVLICNDPPKLPYNDKAAWNRIRVIPFESLFSDNAPEDPDEQMMKKVFPRDPQFSEKIPAMAEAFAWILIQHLRHYPKIRQEPEKVKCATANYRKKNDIYRQFVDDHVVREENNSISVQQCYSLFKEWFREGIPNTPIPTRDDFREYMTKILGEPVASFWMDVRIRSIQAPEYQSQPMIEED